MSLSRVIITGVMLTLAVSLVCIWFYPSFRNFSTSNSTWNGAKDFSDEFNANIIDSLDNLPVLPKGFTLVAIPYIDYTSTELKQLKDFVENGGNLILMDDYSFGNEVLKYLGTGIRFTGKPLLDPLFCYKNERLPKVTELSPRVKESGVEVLLLNHATTLINVTGSQVIAWSSSTSFLDENDNGSQDETEAVGPYPIAAQQRIGEGRIAVVSDPSIMINSMVGRDNNYGFMAYLIGQEETGQGKLLIDRSHITRAPLELSKAGLAKAKEALSARYALIGLVAVMFAAIGVYTLRREDILDKR